MIKARKGRYPKLNSRLLHAVWLFSLVVATLIVIYSAFIYSSNAEAPTPFYSDIAMFLSASTFALLAIIQAIVRRSSRRSAVIGMALTYVVASFCAVCIIGDRPAVYVFGVILIFVTELVLGKRAMICGLIYFTIVMASFGVSFDFMMHPDDGTHERLVSILISTIMMAGTAAVLTWLKTSNLVRIELYEDLKTREELQSRRLETVINSLNDAVLGVDTNDDTIRLYNAATLSLLDTNKDILGLKIDGLFRLTDENGAPLSFAKLIHGSKKVVERSDLIHTYESGQKINLYISISPIRDAFNDADQSDLEGVIVIIRDITKQKSLDDERDEFIAVVSHELRTPVAIAEGALSNIQFLLEKGGNVESLEKTLDDAHQQVLFLSQMVNDLSTLSRAQRGINLEPENIDIKSFLGELHGKYAGDAKKHHLKLELDSHVTGEVRTPRMAIEEVMQNLITNAIKYTAEGSVTIGAHRVDSPNGPEVEFSVRDTGIGISKSDQAHVFRRFWRSEDYRTRETNGTGLGLHVVQQLSSKMSTVIELKSRINHGSTFSFRLPLLAKSTAKNQVSNEGNN